jgi:Domain of unknown function (DUF6431)
MMFMVSPVQTATGAGAWDWIGCAQPTVAARVQHRLPLARSGEGAESCNACQESNAVIIVGDERLAEAECAAHRLVCPDCGGRLRKHGFSRPRSVRTRGGGRRGLRPARARCTGPACRRTHVLLPAWCVPGRADDADTIGSALLAAASGEGHRPIAERLKVPEATVRGWLRAARAHTGWLYQAAASLLHAVDPDDPVVPPSGRSPLWHAVEALGAAAAAIRRFFGAALHTSAWALIVLITAGRLLRPARTRSG